METELIELLPHTIVHYQTVSHDAYGKPVPGAGVSIRCRIVGKMMAIRDANGEIVTSQLTIYANAGDRVITPEDTITLPAGYPDNPIIFTVNRFSNEKGHDHTVIQCGWRYHGQRSF